MASSSLRPMSSTVPGPERGRGYCFLNLPVRMDVGSIQDSSKKVWHLGSESDGWPRLLNGTRTDVWLGTKLSGTSLWQLSARAGGAGPLNFLALLSAPMHGSKGASAKPKPPAHHISQTDVLQSFGRLLSTRDGHNRPQKQEEDSMQYSSTTFQT